MTGDLVQRERPEQVARTLAPVLELLVGVTGIAREAHGRVVQPPVPLLSINELATRLNVQVRHVRRLVAERRVPYIKWGHLIRFDPDDIERWLDASRRPEAG